MEKYYERNYNMTFVARNVDAFLKYRNNGKYPDYYGGMYISDDAYNLIVQIVKEKIPNKESIEYRYYNELFTVDKSIKIEYVNNSYNELEEIINILNDYAINNELPNDLNGFAIDVIKNKVVINFVNLDANTIKDFRKNIINSDLIIFEDNSRNIDDSHICVNYPSNLGDEVYQNKWDNLLISIETGNKDYIPVVLNLYDDGTYEYNVEKILNNSTNADSKSYSMDNLPEYEINLGPKYIEKYNSTLFTVENGKQNIYLDELIKALNVDLSKCAKGEYKE